MSLIPSPSSPQTAPRSAARAKRFRRWLTIGTTVCALLVVHYGLTFGNISSLSQSWTAHEQQTLAFSEAMGELELALGFGGLIHDFKNYLLRGSDPIPARIEAHIEKIELALDKLRGMDLSSDSRDAFKAIEDTVLAYKIRIPIVEELRAANAPIEEIDRKVRVNDTPAIDAIARIKAERKARHELLMNEMRRSMAGLNHLLLVAVVVLLPLIIGAFCILLRQGNETEAALERADQIRRSAESILNLAPEAIILVDQTGTIIRANEAAESLFGHAISEIEGMPLAEIVVHDQPAQHRELVADFFRRPTRRPMGRGMKLEARHASGKHVPVMVGLASFEFDGEMVAMASVFDARFERRVQHGLEAAERQLQLAAKSVGIGVWEWNIKTGDIAWNDMMYTLHGLDVRDCEESFDSWKSAVHPEDTPLLTREIEAAVAGIRRLNARVRVLCDGGKEHTLRSCATLSHDKYGDPALLTGVTWDVSESAALEAKLRRAQKVEALGQLTGGIAHDFNNILAAVAGNLESIGSDLSPEDQADIVESARLACQRGADLTDQLLAFGRRECSNPVAVRVESAITETQRLLQRTLGDRVEIQIAEIEADLPAILVDRGQFENALLNLAINARDAMPTGGTIQVRARLAGPDMVKRLGQSHPGRPASFILVAVSDTGTGMDEEVLARLFEPFYTTKEEGEGSGLGLSMVQNFVTQSSGFILVDSKKHQGTTVSMLFPALPAGSEIAADPHLASDVANDRLLARDGEDVLLIEDDEQVRRVLERQLGSLGYTVDSMAGSQDALARLRSGSEPSILICDVILQGSMRGDSLAHRLREGWTNLPVLFISGFANVRDAEPWSLIHSEVRLAKPFTQDELARAVRRVIDSRHGSQNRTPTTG